MLLYLTVRPAGELKRINYTYTDYTSGFQPVGNGPKAAWAMSKTLRNGNGKFSK